MRLGDSLFFLKGKVWHTRHRPVLNSFNYPVTYIAAPLSRLNDLNNGLFFGFNRPALVSLYEKDYGSRGAGSNHQWVKEQFSKVGKGVPDGEIVLVAMPRFLGYIFNPVCFWLCYDSRDHLKAVVTEVNNTFGETHIYLCGKESGEAILNTDQLTANKVFHVSPFFSMAGGYRFRFDIDSDALAISINYHSDEGHLLLSTRLAGPLQANSRTARAGALVHAPFISVVSILQIYWQAIKLKAKGMPWLPKPKAVVPNLSTTEHFTKSEV